LKNQLLDNDNLHRIAISNTKDTEKRLIRWWCNHYKQPPKQLDEYTIEELFIEQLEEYYIRYPEKIEEFLGSVNQKQEDDWDGSLDPEMEKVIKKRLGKVKVDISKYQNENDKDLTDGK